MDTRALDARPEIHRALRAIAARCDGARTLDQQGFSGVHAAWGKTVAALPTEALDEATVRTGYKVLRVYTKQLSECGIEFAEIPDPGSNGREGRASVQAVRAVVWDGDRARVVFSYDEAVKDSLKRTCRTASWNAAAKEWVVHASDADRLQRWAADQGFTVAGQPGVPGPKTGVPGPRQPGADARQSGAGSVALFAGEIEVKINGFRPDGIDAIKKIPGRHWSPTRKTWLVPVQSARTVRRMAHKLGLTVELPDEVLERSEYPVQLALVGDRVGMLSPYLRELRDEMRSLGGQWQVREGRWLVPLEEFDQLVAVLRRLDLDFDPGQAETVRKLADEIRRNLAEAGALDAELPEIPGLARELRPFQRAGVKWLAEHPSTILGDDVGLGKSIQFLAALELADAFPAVVVCQSTLKANLRREARMTLPGREVAVLKGTKPRPFGLMAPDIVILNYDIVGPWVKVLAGDLRPKALVVDESQLCKELKTQRTQHVIALSELMEWSAKRWELTATPVLNERREYAAQLAILRRLDDMGGEAEVKRMPDIAVRLRRAGLMMRRRKSEVQKDLPPVVWTALPLEPDPKAMADYERAEAELLRYIEERAYEAAREAGSDDPGGEAARAKMRAKSAEFLVRINTLRQIAARAKIPGAKAWTKAFLDSGEKLLVFAHHLSVLDAIQREFRCDAIRGGQTSDQRMAMVDRFQDDDQSRLLALALTAGGVGLTLTAASNALFVEQGWTPASMDQAIGRMYGRINDPHGAQGLVAIVEGTIDEWMVQLIEGKRVEFADAVDGEEYGEEAALKSGSSIFGELLEGLTDVALSHGTVRARVEAQRGS